MRKWLGRIFTGLSLLLLIGTVGMWVRSQRVSAYSEHALWIGAGQRAAIRGFSVFTWSPSCRISLYSHTVDLSEPGMPARCRRDFAAEKKFHFWERPKPPWDGGKWGDFYASAGWFSDTAFEPWQCLHENNQSRPGYKMVVNGSIYSGYQWSLTTVALPWWFLTLCFSLLPARAFVKWRRRRRRGPSQCQHCGYDLRATPDAQGPRLATCPECGHPSAAAAGVAG